VGHGVDPELGGLGRRRACQSAGCHRASLRPMHAVMMRSAHACGYVDNARDVAHISTGATINNKYQFDCSEGLGSDAARHIQATVSPASDDASTMTRAIFLRIWTAIHTHGDPAFGTEIYGSARQL
jgi:hypothetical protein